METVLERTFEGCFPELFRVAYRAAYRVTGDAAAAEDAASEALVRAGLRWRRIRDRALPWVVRVATNLAIDQARRRAREHPAGRAGDAEGTDAAEGPGDGIEAVQASVDLHRALKALPKRQREVVVLRYFGDLSEREIADELGLAPGSVKSHASRGLAALRARLADGTPDGHLEPEELR
jgi:RNA polymerase sigma-70 factor (sigma-E family)